MPTRRVLTGICHMGSTPPGQFATPPTEDDLAWEAVAALMPVAAARQAAGRWHLDDAPFRFDAQDWWFRLRFDAIAAEPDCTQVLGLDGLATLAEVWLNGRSLLQSNNMFVAHECDVSARLCSGTNELVMVFRALDTALGQARPRPRWRTPMVAHQQLRWFRTTLLGRTPGWSPPAAVVGPWRPVWLAKLQRGDIASTCKPPVLHTQLEGTTGLVHCRIERLESAMSPHLQAVAIPHLQLARGGQVFTQALKLDSDRRAWVGVLRLASPALWWPHTHGEPALYQASVRWGTHVDAPLTALGALGFRRIELKTQGGEFSISVNGVPVFCRGAVWTPLDPVSLRASAAQCASAVAQARAAGMNMLRIAGTMVYEEDSFYAACDAQGVLVWQDFMFASMDYPFADAGFEASALQEARQALLRLQGRPCLALLCGNSEVAQQAAMWGASHEAGQPAFFTDVLARLCAALAPGTAYWPSSAHGGAFAFQASAGSSAYYGVGAYLRPLDDARRAQLRFASECLAFANVPSELALARMPGGLATRACDAHWKARSPRDLLAGWDFDDVRDHYLETIFQIDTRQLRRTDHARYLNLSRLASGEAMAASMAEWRRPGSPCGGALVLYLRDLWAGAGWGLLDETGQPKACWHYLRRVQQPMAVLLSDEGVNGLWLHLLNEHADSELVTLELSAWRDGEVRVAHAQQALTLAPRSAQSLCSLTLLGHFSDLTHAYQFGPAVCDTVVASLRNAQGLISQAFYFLDSARRTQTADVGLRVSLRWLDAQHAELSLHSTHVAYGVHLEVPGFLAEDDFFHLSPCTPRCIRLRSQRPQALSGWVHAVNARHSAHIALAAYAASPSTEQHMAV
jgi:beta-mannosidase